MNPRWLLMPKRWAQNPPSMGKMKFVVAIVCFASLFTQLNGFGAGPIG
jgi:hypothetical protein